MSNKFLGLNSVNVLKDYIDKHIEEEFDRIEIENTEGTIVMPDIALIKDAENDNYYWAVDGEFLTGDDGEKIQANGTQGPKGDPGDQGPQGEQGPQGIDGKPADLVVKQVYSLGSKYVPFTLKSAKGIDIATEELPRTKIFEFNTESEVKNSSGADITTLCPGSIIYIKDTNTYYIKRSKPSQQFAAQSLEEYLHISIDTIFKNNDYSLHIWCRDETTPYVYDDASNSWILGTKTNYGDFKLTLLRNDVSYDITSLNTNEDYTIDKFIDGKLYVSAAANYDTSKRYVFNPDTRFLVVGSSIKILNLNALYSNVTNGNLNKLMLVTVNSTTNKLEGVSSIQVSSGELVEIIYTGMSSTGIHTFYVKK